MWIWLFKFNLPATRGGSQDVNWFVPIGFGFYMVTDSRRVAILSHPFESHDSAITFFGLNNWKKKKKSTLLPAMSKIHHPNLSWSCHKSLHLSSYMEWSMDFHLPSTCFVILGILTTCLRKSLISCPFHCQKRMGVIFTGSNKQVHYNINKLIIYSLGSPIFTHGILEQLLVINSLVQSSLKILPVCDSSFFTCIKYTRRIVLVIKRFLLFLKKIHLRKKFLLKNWFSNLI